MDKWWPVHSASDIRRVGHIKRWHMVGVHREQTLGEHLGLCALLVLMLGPEIGFDRATTNEAARWALLHDLDEIYTGDMAPPLKRAYELMCPGFADVTQELRDRMMPGPWCVERSHTKKSAAYDLVKICDLIEARSFLREGRMTVHTSEVDMRLDIELRDVLDACKAKWPGYGWDNVREFEKGINFGRVTTIDTLMGKGLI